MAHADLYALLDIMSIVHQEDAYNVLFLVWLATQELIALHAKPQPYSATIYALVIAVLVDIGTITYHSVLIVVFRIVPIVIISLVFLAQILHMPFMPMVSFRIVFILVLMVLLLTMLPEIARVVMINVEPVIMQLIVQDV